MPMAEMIEHWIPTDYPGHEVSNFGQVRNVTTGRIKKLSPIRKKQYLSVNLQQGGRANKRVFYVHELVATAFYGERPKDENGKPMVIDHIDGNKWNNRLDNLEYVTQAENVRRHRARMQRLAIEREKAEAQLERGYAMAVAV